MVFMILKQFTTACIFNFLSANLDLLINTLLLHFVFLGKWTLLAILCPNIFFASQEGGFQRICYCKWITVIANAKINTIWDLLPT